MLNPSDIPQEEEKMTETGIEKQLRWRRAVYRVEEITEALLPWENCFKLIKHIFKAISKLAYICVYLYILLIQFLLAVSFPGFE